MKRVVEVRPTSIAVTNRHRTDLGELDSLMASIKEVGVLQPIVCRSVDGSLTLVAGERRLEACKRLGWKNVPVLVVDRLDTATKALTAERDENQCRKAMTPLELKSLTDALLEIEREAAKERQREGQRLGRAVQRGEPVSDHVVGNGQEAKAAAAKAAGWSRSQYERVERVEKAAADESLPEPVRATATEVMKKMESGELSPNQADLAVKDAKVEVGIASTAEKIDKAKRDNAEPAGSGKSRAEVEQKIATYMRMADEGCTSRQISEAIGVQELSAFRKRHGLAVPPADGVVGKSLRHDPNRILSEMVYGLEAYAMSIELIDVAAIDADQIDEWASSIKKSIRQISHFVKELTP